MQPEIGASDHFEFSQKSSRPYPDQLESIPQGGSRRSDDDALAAKAAQGRAKKHVIALKRSGVGRYVQHH